MSEDMFINCVSCGKELQGEIWGEERKFPGVLYAGIICRTRGNYGSTVWDQLPHQKEELYFAICDDCLKSKSEHFYHIECTERKFKYKVVSFKKFVDEWKEQELWWKPIGDLLKSIFGEYEYKVTTTDKCDRIGVYAHSQKLKERIRGLIGDVVQEDGEWVFKLNHPGRVHYLRLLEAYPNLEKYMESRRGLVDEAELRKD